jgi:hypothetical protein
MVVRKSKPAAAVAPKAEQPAGRSDDEMPSAQAGLANTVLAADSLPQARARGAANAYGSRVSRHTGLAVTSVGGAKRSRDNILRKAGGGRAAAPLSRNLGQGRSRQFMSPRANVTRTSRLARKSAVAIKAHRKADPAAPAQRRPPAVHPPQVSTPQPPSAAAQAPAPSSVRQTTPAPRPVVTTVPRQQQPTQPPRVIEPAPPLDKWEKYVAKTSAMYGFTDAQDAKARSILSDLKHRARQYQLTRGPAFQEAERLQDAGARAARLKHLNRPIDLLFDELKQRLDNLPTIPQKLHTKRHAAQRK